MVIRHHEGCFFWMCAMSPAAETNALNQTQKGLYAHNIPKGEQLICFKNVLYLTCNRKKKQTHLFYEYVVEFNKRRVKISVFKLKCL